MTPDEKVRKFNAVLLAVSEAVYRRAPSREGVVSAALKYGKRYGITEADVYLCLNMTPNDLLKGAGDE